jgi:hypothetical protein
VFLWFRHLISVFFVEAATVLVVGVDAVLTFV